MNIQIIGESEFKKIEAARRALAHAHARKFAVLDLGNTLGLYGLSWCSELVEPIVELSLDKRAVWVGVDQQIAAICLSQGQIRLSLALNSNLVQILVGAKLTAVLTEDEVLLFNPDFSIRLIKGLPDLAEEIVMTNESGLEIWLMSGESLFLDMQTGAFLSKVA
ncbi:hypothetical protein [Allocoleopsis sp.]|uniref:hypothetical protein n=1 Tax=Allocoleopsis sp. TaxID=3088169 RepID=UPI002FD7775A